MFKHTVGDASGTMILETKRLEPWEGMDYRGRLPCKSRNEKEVKGTLPCQLAYMVLRKIKDRNVTIALYGLYESEFD